MLDIGCGWGALLDRLVRVHGTAAGVGLTLSPGQADFAARRNVTGASYLLQNCSRPGCWRPPTRTTR